MNMNFRTSATGSLLEEQINELKKSDTMGSIEPITGSLYISDTTTYHTISTPKQYKWNPKEDITPYELALCIPLLLDRLNPYPYISDEIKRHFDEV